VITFYLAPFPSYGQIFTNERRVPQFNALAGGNCLSISP